MWLRIKNAHYCTEARGYRVHGTTSTKTGPTGRKSAHSRYMCTTHQRGHVAVPPCPLPSIAVRILDGAVWDWVCQLLDDEDRLRAELEQRHHNNDAERGAWGAAIKDETQTLLAIEQKQDRLVDALADGVLSKAAYEKKNAALSQQAADAHSRVMKLQQRLAASATPPPVESVVEFARTMRQRTANATFADKRALIELLNVTAELAPGEVGTIQVTFACEIAVQKVCVQSRSRSTWATR